nr:hypothetical protein CFP56_20682 [Quercus suber]
MAFQTLDMADGQPQSTSVRPKSRSAFSRACYIFSFIHPKVIFGWDDVVTTRSTGTSWLDGLRGAAALQVFFFHFFGLHTLWGHSFGSSTADMYFYQLPIFRSIYLGGSTAVCTFFIISGNAISVKTFTLLRRKNHDALYKSLSSSMIRRGFRLFVPILILAVPGFILLCTVDMVREGSFAYQWEVYNNFGKQLVHFITSTDAHLNPFMYADTNPSKNRYAYVPSSWTIPMEYYGSLVVYLMTLVIARVEIFAYRCAIIGSLSLYALHQGSWWTSLFLNGMLLADTVLEQKSRAENKKVSFVDEDKAYKARFKRVLWDALFFGLFCVGYYIMGVPPKTLSFDFNPVPREGYEFLYPLIPNFDAFRIADRTRWLWYWSGMFTVVGISQVSWLRVIFETKFFQWLGKLSFMLYLVHPAVIAALGPYLKPIAESLTSSKALLTGFEFVVFVPIIFSLSALAERWIDQPSVTFARWVERIVTKEAEVPLAMQQEFAEEQIPLRDRPYPRDTLDSSRAAPTAAAAGERPADRDEQEEQSSLLKEHDGEERR